MLSDVCGRVIWREGEVLRFATDQNKAEMHLKQTKKGKYGSIEDIIQANSNTKCPIKIPHH